MTDIEQLFVTKIYRARISGRGSRALPGAIETAIQSLSVDDGAGIAWCEKNGYRGYTSYASLDDLPWRFPEFAELKAHIDGHVAAFAADLDLDLGGRSLVLDSMWVNLLRPGGYHAAHIHPHSVVSGTFYVRVPDGAQAIRFEDPRLPSMMAAPPRRKRASRANQTFVTIAPRPGDLLLWEGFLRHDVPENRGADERMSVSFNYALGEETAADHSDEEA